MLVSAVQQSDSVIHLYILFHSLFRYGLLQDTEYRSSLLFNKESTYELNASPEGLSLQGEVAS